MQEAVGDSIEDDRMWYVDVDYLRLVSKYHECDLGGKVKQERRGRFTKFMLICSSKR